MVSMTLYLDVCMDVGRGYDYGIMLFVMIFRFQPYYTIRFLRTISNENTHLGQIVFLAFILLYSKYPEFGVFNKRAILCYFSLILI